MIFKEAVIDADYFNKITERNSSGELFLTVMREMCVIPVMHEYVAHNELMGNSTAQELIKNGDIVVYYYNDFITEQNREDYISKFNSAFTFMNSKKPPADVFDYMRSNENLGEIRSSLMAWFMNFDYFMSEDVQAKYFVSTILIRKVKKVYNLYDTFMELDLSKTSLKWSIIKPTIREAFSNRPKQFENIENKWKKD